MKEKITYKEACERFDEVFNEVHPMVEFGPLAYEAVDVLKAVDPIAYHQEVLNYIDSLLVDGLEVEGF